MDTNIASSNFSKEYAANKILTKISVETIKDLVEGVPNMSYKQAKIMESFIVDHNIQNILELGFAHGVSTLYFSAILESNLGGNIVSIDLSSAKERKPNIEELFSHFNFKKTNIEAFCEEKSYIWALMKMIEIFNRPVFDFCYIDGAHNWYTDGFAFFLADKLLKKDGWIVFDDINWTYTRSKSMKDTQFVRDLPYEEKYTPQIKKVFNLLVMQHPSYGNFEIRNNWGYAQKIKII